MTPSPDIVSWKLSPVPRGCANAAAVLVSATGFVFGVGPGLHLGFITSWVSQPGSDVGNILWGTAAIAGAVTCLVLVRRVRLVLSDEALFIQNMFRSYRVFLSEIVRVSPSRYGVSVEYVREGRRRWAVAMAAQGVKNEWLFNTGRAHSIADIIAARLPSATHREPSQAADR